jgi:DNA polymerase I-like protein with 3'-5' exonuclease and polymerase domains
MTEKGEYGYMKKTPENMRWLLALFSDKSKTIVMHNGKFELKMLMAEGWDVFALMDNGARCEDTLLQSKVLNSTEQNHDLRFCGKRYVGRRTEDKDEIKDYLKAANTKRQIRERGRKLNFTDVPDDILKRRVLWDVETTLLLYAFFRSRVRATCPKLYETERELMYVCVDMETHGVLIDVTRARQLKAQALKDLEYIRLDLNKLVLPIVVTKTHKGEKVQEDIDDDFNPGSPQQLEGAFRKLGIELKYKTQPKKDKKTGKMVGGGGWAFDEYAMVRYVSKPLAMLIKESSEEAWSAKKFYDSVHRVIKENGLAARELLPPLVLKFRELDKMVTTYYDHLINDSVNHYFTPAGHEYATLHCKFNQSEAMTGRFSSSEPNLQNMPRSMGPRECFVTRPGQYNVHVDYSQVEMRMFSHFARDQGMAKAVEDDIHLYIATRIYKKPRDQISKEQRKRAKATGFGVLYGSGPPKQAETLTRNGLPTSKLEASLIVAAFHREFPSVRRLTNDLKIQLMRVGYIENPFGRRYYIPEKFGYKGLNYMCQGTPADLIKAAMVAIWKWLRAEGLWPRIRIIVQIHDELVFEMPRSLAAATIPQLTARMEDKTSYFVPITCEVEIADKRWSEKKDPSDVGLQLVPVGV